MIVCGVNPSRCAASTVACERECFAQNWQRLVAGINVAVETKVETCSVSAWPGCGCGDEQSNEKKGDDAHGRRNEINTPDGASTRKSGARGGSRTHMRKNPRRILSPQRLPFRHPGTGTTNLTNRK